jgi:hypothetical protein
MQQVIKMHRRNYTARQAAVKPCSTRRPAAQPGVV